MISKRIRMAHKAIAANLLLPSALLLTAGCSSIIDAHSQKKELMAEYRSGNFAEAEKRAADKADSRQGSGDELMWRLEEGSASFDAGNNKQAITALDQAEALTKEFDQRAEVSARDAGAEAGSAMTNPNAIPYRGFCYDRIMLNTMKALAYFADGNADGALVELRRLREVQKQISRRFADDIKKEEQEIVKAQAENARQTQSLGGGPRYSPSPRTATPQPATIQGTGAEQLVHRQKLENNPVDVASNDGLGFSQLKKNPEIAAAWTETLEKSAKTYGSLMNPFAVYMSALGYLYEKNYAEALVDFRNLYRIAPDNPLLLRDYVTVAHAIGDQTPPELAAVKPWGYPLDRNIVYVIFANGSAPALRQVKFQIVLPWVGYTGLAFPRYEYYPAPYQNLVLTVNGQNLNTVTVGDMDAVAAEEYRQRMPVMITRIVISYLVKETASMIATQAAMQANNAAGIGAYIATGIYKYLFNTADTRCWEMLAKQYQIAHFPIPVDRVVKIMPEPSAGGSAPSLITLKPGTRFAVIYVRAVTHGPLQIKTCEFN